jgi:hypothetical protein
MAGPCLAQNMDREERHSVARQVDCLMPIAVIERCSSLHDFLIPEQTACVVEGWEIRGAGEDELGSMIGEN